MGLMDRDWYWKRREGRNSPDDDYLFPRQPWTARRSVLFPLTAVAVGMLALLVFFVGLRQGWFDGEEFSRDAKVRAEERALRAFDEKHYLNGRPAVIPQARVVPDLSIGVRPPPRDEARALAEGKRDTTIDLIIGFFAVPAPIVLLALITGLFIRPVRGPAVAGLMFGFAGGVAGAIAQSLNLTQQDSGAVGSLLQGAAKVGCFFTLTAIVAAVVTFVRTTPSSAPAVTNESAPPARLD